MEWPSLLQTPSDLSRENTRVPEHKQNSPKSCSRRTEEIHQFISSLQFCSPEKQQTSTKDKLSKAKFLKIRQIQVINPKVFPRHQKFPREEKQPWGSTISILQGISPDMFHCRDGDTEGPTWQLSLECTKAGLWGNLGGLTIPKAGGAAEEKEQWPSSPWATGAAQEPALLQEQMQSSSPAQILLWLYRTNLISGRAPQTPVSEPKT